MTATSMNISDHILDAIIGMLRTAFATYSSFVYPTKLKQVTAAFPDSLDKLPCLVVSVGALTITELGIGGVCDATANNEIIYGYSVAGEAVIEAHAEDPISVDHLTGAIIEMFTLKDGIGLGLTDTLDASPNYITPDSPKADGIRQVAYGSSTRESLWNNAVRCGFVYELQFTKTSATGYYTMYDIIPVALAVLT